MKNVYIEFSKLYIFLKNVECTKLDSIYKKCVCWIYRVNYVHCSKNVYIEFINCVGWMYGLVKLFEKYIRWMFRIGYILGKLCTLNIKKFVNSMYTIMKNIRNSIHSLNNVYMQCTIFDIFFEKNLHWMYKIMYIFWKMCILNLLNCTHTLKICVCEMYKIEFILWKIMYV